MILIQARTTSTRLPRKCIKLMAGQELWTYSYATAAMIDQTFMVIPADDQLMIDHCKALGANYMTGSRDDVLDRYYQCATKLGLHEGPQIVRLTSDCPLVPAELILYMIHSARVIEADYYACSQKTGGVDGWDVEVISYRLLEYVWQQTNCPLDNPDYDEITATRQHVVGPWVWGHLEELRSMGYVIEAYRPNYLLRWFPKMSVDTQEDFDRVEKIVTEIRDLG